MKSFKSDWLVLWLILFLVGACLFWKLNDLPSLHGDEGASGVQAIMFLKREEKSLFKMGWSEQPMLSFAFQAGFLKIFGQNIFGLRSTSVFFGLLSLIPFYFLSRYFFSFSLLESVVLTFFYSFSHWFLAMARLGINYVQILPFQLFSFLFLLLAFQSQKKPFSKVLFTGAGFLGAVPIYLYHAGRVVPFLSLGCFFLFSSWKKKKLKKNFLNLGLFVLGMAFASAPFFYYYLIEPESFFIRAKDVMIFNKFPDAFGHYQVESGFLIIIYQFLETIKVFFIGGDNSEQYGYQGPLIPLFFQPFLIYGLIWGLIDLFKKPAWRGVLFWFLGVLFLGGCLTIGPYPPFVPRLVGSLPMVFFLIGLGVKKISELGVLRKIRAPYYLLLLVAWAVINFSVYFGNYVFSLKAGWANYEPATVIGFYLADLGKDWQASFFGCSQFYPLQGNISFLAYDITRQGELDFNQALKEVQKGYENQVFIFLPYQIEKERDWWESYRKNLPKFKPERLSWEKEIEALEKKFPQRVLKEFFRADGTPLFSAYEVEK